jgi:hypothetical protein
VLQLCLAALCLSGCRPRITNDNLAVVNHEYERSEEMLRRGNKDGSPVGVSPKEVESILGPPAEVQVEKLALETQKKEVEVTRYIYRQDGQKIVVHFFDNKLITKIDLLAKPGQPQPQPQP